MKRHLLSPLAGRVDMLEGPLLRNIIIFSIPLILSGVLQQSFNSVDIAVVGRYCSSQSLAAVGSNGVVISLIVNLFLGISIGANVVIAHYLGERDNASAHRAVNTVMTVAVVCGLILTAVGVLVSRPILEAIGTPADVIEPATVYLRLYFLGIPFMMLFNFGSAVMRSVGDTARPFYCLVAGGIVNVALNLVLVLGFDMDVAGVAIGTVMSNVVSSVLLVRIMVREPDPVCLDIRRPHIDRNELRKMLNIGIPAGIQGVVFPFSNLLIVSGINTFGAAGSAGSAAALNYEYYCYFVIAAFASAAVAFTGQNFGARNAERCNAVFRNCLLLAFVCCGVLNVFITWQKEFFVGFFTEEAEVMEYAFMRVETVLLFQFVASSYEIAGACMRGMGYSMTPTVITIFGTCVMRVGWVYMFHNTALISGMTGLLTVYPVTWVLTGIAVLTAYLMMRRRAYARIGVCDPHSGIRFSFSRR